MAKKQINFQAAYGELEQLVGTLETMEDLDASIELYEKGLELIAVCQKRLSEIENKVTEIREKYPAGEKALSVEKSGDLV
ncbi:MAG: hypothetical protein G01um101418_398 [Parcubacteria group bacterium Gr01-1014_18]|nr:MAG: hypothetical protein Greene041636_356 [Parcubacteria group bacterium Greene0416_36]TSC81119.1 MAG: hypothetical protein G01um101418_398 [Parcubacteria group bacterium Gr01-1014_18]TSC98464.1 MAG: hypothetical protein Greene101420_701 [Parcubacteria group bacterium Greene1014_20]TSD07370.1 MAG: hypothetical protein Greene07142_225 [Parcubacteria group bacterium Greene0714_2]